MFNFTQQQALFVPYLPSKAKPTLVGMNTKVTLRKSNIIWTAVDSLLFIRNFNKGQRKKAAVQQRASPALAQLLHKMGKFQNEKVNTTLYSSKKGRDFSSQSLEMANLTLMKCKHSPPNSLNIKAGIQLWFFPCGITLPMLPTGWKAIGAGEPQQQQQARTVFLTFMSTSLRVLLDRRRVHSQSLPTAPFLVYCNLGKHPQG